MKSVQIVIHCLPREIDQLERVCNSLRENYHFCEDISIVLDVTLNLNSHFTNWENSKIPKSFFIDKFFTIANLHKDIFKINFTPDEKGNCLGINDKRRNSINDNIKADYIMYMDLDVFFPNISLYMLFQLLNTTNEEYIIVSSELVKLWDDSWDGLVNKHYQNKPFDCFKNIDPYTANKITFDNISRGELSIRENNPIKFGGGWFNVFSKSLLKFINIPITLGSYGVDDTFVMMASNIMKEKGYQVKQYILEGVVCIENYSHSLYKFNPYKEFIDDLSLGNKGKEFKHNQKQQAHQNFQKELINFQNKI